MRKGLKYFVVQGVRENGDITQLVRTHSIETPWTAKDCGDFRNFSKSYGIFNLDPSQVTGHFYPALTGLNHLFDQPQASALLQPGLSYIDPSGLVKP